MKPAQWVGFLVWFKETIKLESLNKSIILREKSLIS